MSGTRIVIAAIKKHGVIFTGTRHGLIIRDMVECGFLKDATKDYVHSSEQGFVDNENNYLSRKDARAVALKSGQIKDGHGTLYSEDLW